MNTEIVLVGLSYFASVVHKSPLFIFRHKVQII